MCKFNSRLFVFLVVASLLLLTIEARPSSDKRSLVDALSYGNDFDLRYDQRQKGTENFRLKLDGFFIGVPAEATGLFLTSEEFIDVLSEELLLGRQGENPRQSEENKSSPNHITAAESMQKQVENYQKAELEKAEEEEALIASQQKPIAEGRGNFNHGGGVGVGGGGSRTKVYVMNLIDYIRRNRRN